MKNIGLKLALSAACLVLLVVHLAVPGLTLDAIAFGLVVTAVLPWLSDLIKTLELPSGFKVEFQELRGEVAQQKRDLDGLTEFLFTHFLTDAEFNHLEALSSGRPYPFQRAPYFDTELRRLRALGLLTGVVGTVPDKGADLNDHFRITEHGREYVSRRKSIAPAAMPRGGSTI